MPRPQTEIQRKKKEIVTQDGMVIMHHPDKPGKEFKVDSRQVAELESRGFVNTGRFTGNTGFAIPFRGSCAVNAPTDPSKKPMSQQEALGAMSDSAAKLQGGAGTVGTGAGATGAAAAADPALSGGSNSQPTVTTQVGSGGGGKSDQGDKANSGSEGGQSEANGSASKDGGGSGKDDAGSAKPARGGSN